MATETKTNEFLGTGRRKTAVARVRLASGNGKITVNGRAFENYFPLETLRAHGGPAVDRHRHGGKIRRARQRHRRRAERPGRRGAARHCPRAAAIRRRPCGGALKAEGLLTRDPRMKERKKYGQPGARKRFQYSKR